MAREAAFAAKKLLNEREGVLFHDVALAATEAMRKDTEKAMKVFYKITLN